MEKKKKIAICVPSRDIWKAKFGMSLCKMFAVSLLHSNSDIAIMNEKGATVSFNRNKLVNQALKQKCDYILFLDDDMVFPHDTLLRLLAHDKDIVGCNCAKKQEECGSTGKDLEGRWITPKEEGLESIRYIGGAVLLIKTSVFENLTFPYFQEDVENGYGEDAYFCAKVRDAGLEVFCDHGLSKEIGHVGEKEYRLNV